MLTYNFKRIFQLRGIVKPFSFLVKNGFSPAFATRIANNRSRRLNLPDLERLCELLNCTPNDLMQWSPEKGRDPAGHPLAALRRENTGNTIAGMLANLPLDKLTEIENKLRNELNEK